MFRVVMIKRLCECAFLNGSVDSPVGRVLERVRRNDCLATDTIVTLC